MLSKDQAQRKLEEALPDSPVQSCSKFNDLYLFRVKFPMPDEEHYDPFFSVHSSTGEVREFSVLTDGDITEIADLEWENI